MRYNYSYPLFPNYAAENRYLASQQLFARDGNMLLVKSNYIGGTLKCTYDILIGTQGGWRRDSCYTSLDHATNDFLDMVLDESPF